MTTTTPAGHESPELDPAQAARDAAFVPTDVAPDAATTVASSVHAQDTSFADYDVRPEIIQALADAGITHPFPIQAMTLPVALSGHDIIGQAKTGTGKTLGFGVPLLNRVVSPGEPGFDELPSPGKPQALVVVPTRELAVQVANDLGTASKLRTVRIAQVYGGRAYEPQVEQLKSGVEVVVGTPGRMIDLMNQGHLNLTRASIVVLDEADEMLDLGFLPDVEKLLARTPAQRHTMLFSATMPGAVVSMARRYMSQPTHIRAADPDDDGKTVKAIKQVVYRAHSLDKIEVLARLLQARGRGLTIVFARTKRTAARVAEDLDERGFAAGAIHGDLGQGAREQALRAFRSGKIDVLVATDVAARGIDVDDVTHVVNYQCPEDEKIYLHRTGRTGRAGNTGTAVTFVDWDDIPRWGLIDKALDLGIPEPEETYSTSPHLFADLDIPEGTKGRLPREARVRAGLDAEVLEDLGETGRHAGGGARGAGGRGAGGGRRDAGGAGGGARGAGGRDAAGGRREASDARGRSGTDRTGRAGDERVGGEHGRRRGTEHGVDGEARPSRQRRRTRGGKPIEARGDAAGGPDGAGRTPAADAPPVDAGVEATAPDASREGSVRTRQRRRTRAGRPTEATAAVPPDGD